MTTTETDIDLLLDSILDVPRKLILLNDDVSPIDLVLNTIIEVLGYPASQAEQITMIAHLKGKAHLKTGEYEELVEIHDKFASRNISTEIE